MAFHEVRLPARLGGDRWDMEPVEVDPRRFRLRVLDDGLEKRVWEVEEAETLYPAAQAAADWPGGVGVGARAAAAARSPSPSSLLNTPPHPTASGAHLLPRGEKGKVRLCVVAPFSRGAHGLTDALVFF